VTELSPLIRAYLQDAPTPLRIWLGPEAARRLSPELRLKEQLGADVIAAPTKTANTPPGPATLLLHESDLRGVERPLLLSLAAHARPGRPVLVGGLEDRDTLLDAINVWRVFRVLPEDSSPRTIRDTLNKAHGAASMELALNRAASELERDTARLGQAVDQLGETQDRLLHTERVTTMGRMADGLRAAMKSHVDALESFKGMLDHLKDDSDIGPLISLAEDGIDSLDGLLDELRAYGDKGDAPYDLQEHAIDDLVSRTVTFCCLDPLSHGREVITDLTSGAKILADRHRFYQVVINLIRNAFQATIPGDRVSVLSYIDGSDVVIEVQDTGYGMADEIREHIFEPFFSTKGEQGMGIGLAVVKTTVERHGGEIGCKSALGAGTTFSIRLPLAR
jgi:signal transduction histidine kinase